MTVTGMETYEEGDESLLNIFPLIDVYPGKNPKSS